MATSNLGTTRFILTTLSYHSSLSEEVWAGTHQAWLESGGGAGAEAGEGAAQSAFLQHPGTYSAGMAPPTVN